MWTNLHFNCVAYQHTLLLSPMAAFYVLYLASKAATFLTLLYKISPQIPCKMMMMGPIYFLLAIELYKRVFHAFMGIFIMDCVTKFNDFGFGFLVFGCFNRVFNLLGLLFVFILGFKFIHCKKSSGANHDDDCVLNGVKKLSLRCGTTKMKRVFCKSCCGDQKCEEINELSSCGAHEGEEEECCCNEDQVFDVMALRRMVKEERRKANAANIELEKERMAASSAVDEAMAMILRLQNEKSGLQIRVNQLERVAEDKELHDREVIQSLQWIIMKHESERGLLEDQLRLCREKLRQFMKGEEWDQFDCVCPTPSAAHSSFEIDDHDGMIGALDFDSSPL